MDDSIQSFAAIKQEIERKLATPQGREELRTDEREYRRGYHDGFGDGIETAFRLLARGVSREEAQRLLVTFDVQEMMAWRREERLFEEPPIFPCEQYPRKNRVKDTQRA